MQKLRRFFAVFLANPLQNSLNIFEKTLHFFAVRGKVWGKKPKKKGCAFMGNYILYPTSYARLGAEMKLLVDDYQTRKITLDVFIGTLNAWKANCDFMMGADGELAPGLDRIIGKKRAAVVTKALENQTLLRS